MDELVVGADIGGSATRVGVADLGGTVLSLARGGPGNPNVVGLAASSSRISTVVATALSGVTGTVRMVVIGLAGGSRAAGDPEFARAAMPAGVEVLPLLVSDLSVAFCSATPAGDGCVLLAGTGSVAGRLRAGEVVEQQGGRGWLLGDEGSGFWIGRQAVRSTLDGLQRQASDALSLGPLHRAVRQSAGVADYLQLLQACYTASPTWLAQFSPLVSEQADRDPVAAEIATEAAQHLETLLLSLGPVPAQPLVLAGSVLATPGPVSRMLRSRLQAGGPNSILTATSGVVGALWLALQRHGVGDPAVHRRLVSTAAGALAQN